MWLVGERMEKKMHMCLSGREGGREECNVAKCGGGARQYDGSEVLGGGGV